MSNPKPVSALTIAGSDPSGGAGLQADLKTFQQLGVYGMSAITLLTVQNTQGVSAVKMIDPQLIQQQIDAVLDDIPPQAIKIGALGSSEVVKCVSDRLKHHDPQLLRTAPLVVDPVMVSKHGHLLVADDFVNSFSEQILPLATVITPNRFEAERLCGSPINSPADAERAARDIASKGSQFVVVKFGNVDGNYVVTLASGEQSTQFHQPFVTSNATHGTGCVLSAIITAKLAYEGITKANIEWELCCDLVRFAMRQVSESLQLSSSAFGRGISPVETRSLRH